MKTETIIITIIIIYLLNGTSAVLLQLSLPPSVDAPEGGSATLPCSFFPLTIDLNALFIQWWIVSKKIVDRGSIYDSHFKNTRPKVAEFAGAEVNGDCSLKILNVSRTDNLEFKCQVLCFRCNTENTKVEGSVKLNVTAAEGYVGGTFGAPGVETTPTHGLSSPDTDLPVIGLCVGMILGLGVGFVAITKITMRRRPPKIVHLSNSAQEPANVQGDVNGVLLVTNGRHAEDEQGQEEHQENGTNII